MAIVDFDQIELLLPGDVASLKPGMSNGVTPVSVIVDGGVHRTVLYDPVWGYYVFQQSVGTEWSPAAQGQTVAVFTIFGAFTANAGNFTDGPIASEADAFTQMTGKYDALEAMLRAAVDAADPDDYADWNGPLDPRAVALPEPLRDVDSDRIYAHPESLQIGPGPYVSMMTYTAVLRECRRPAAKLVLNGVVVDNGVVTLTPPAPQFSSHPLVGANGSIVQVKNYSRTTVEVAGTVPAQQGVVRVSSKLKELIRQAQDNNLDMAIVERRPGTTDRTTSLWGHMLVLSPAAVQDVPSEQGTFRITGSL